MGCLKLTYKHEKSKSFFLLHTNEGIVNVSGTTYAYEYFLKDHPGNTRVVLKSDGTIDQAVDYYPFGLDRKINDNLNNKYLYNGKELQEDNLGTAKLDWYDYGARFYDPQIGRWTVIDNKAEKYIWCTPYAYAVNNPIKYIDPDGNRIVLQIQGENGQQTRNIIYSNGKARWADTKKIYDGTGGNRIVDQVIQAYQEIEASDDNVLKNQLHTLERSKNDHIVGAGDDNGIVDTSPTSPENGESSATMTTLSDSKDVKENYEKRNGIKFSFFGIIVHELRHQYDYETGNMKDDTKKNDAENPAEIRAVNNENRARKKKDEKPRTKYDGKEIDPNKLEHPQNNR